MHISSQLGQKFQVHETVSNASDILGSTEEFLLLGRFLEPFFKMFSFHKAHCLLICKDRNDSVLIYIIR